MDAYLDTLAKIDPLSLAGDEQFAFYINAYNAWTIKLILTGYPDVASIKDYGSLFKSPWKKKFVNIKGEMVTLDHIEHDILRPQFRDPRVHFAINCAAKSCPPLYREAFVGQQLNTQLDDAARRFVNDGRFNRLEGNTLYVSSIFKWFKEDFNGDIIGFFEEYALPELKEAIGANRTAPEGEISGLRLVFKRQIKIMALRLEFTVKSFHRPLRSRRQERQEGQFLLSQTGNGKKSLILRRKFQFNNIRKKDSRVTVKYEN